MAYVEVHQPRIFDQMDFSSGGLDQIREQIAKGRRDRRRALLARHLIWARSHRYTVVILLALVFVVLFSAGAFAYSKVTSTTPGVRVSQTQSCDISYSSWWRSPAEKLANDVARAVHCNDVAAQRNLQVRFGNALDTKIASLGIQ